MPCVKNDESSGTDFRFAFKVPRRFRLESGAFVPICYERYPKSTLFGWCARA
jgi:hypothetical protein